MKLSQVAAQLYTVRDHLKTAADVAASLKKVREIGYQAVQISGMAPLPEAEVARMLTDNGLVCCATHEPGIRIIEEPQIVIDRLAALGCKYTAYPYPANVDFTTMAGIRDLAGKLDKSGAALRAAGQVLCYHNHAIEFYKVEGRTVLDHLYDLTDPNNLQGEPDTYWVQAGGGDCVAWCRKLAGRLPLLHLKDYGMTADNKPYFAEIGNGNLDWKPILAAAEASGCEWFIIEQDTCPGDPFDSLKISFEYVRDHLCA